MEALLTPATERFSSASIDAMVSETAEKGCIDSPAPPPTPSGPTVASPSPTPAFCFSRVAVVNVAAKGPVPMSSVRIGDYVEVQNNHFAKVYSFAHLHLEEETEFLQVYTNEMLTDPLEISSKHLIFANGFVIQAAELRVGDHLKGRNNDDILMVTRISSVRRKGFFAPLTESGTLIVNDVLVSNYVSFLTSTILDQHFLSHLLLGPVRLLCYGFAEFCEVESYDNNGYSKLYSWVIYAAILLGRMPAWFTWFCSLAFLPCMLVVGLGCDALMLLSSQALGWGVLLCYLFLVYGSQLLGRCTAMK